MPPPTMLIFMVADEAWGEAGRKVEKKVRGKRVTNVVVKEYERGILRIERAKRNKKICQSVLAEKRTKSSGARRLPMKTT